ncbi:hypothetical protein SDC9_137419 [bioreactor metagenome]|uniref:SH3b domain-containing protein n=1 Tax=bioreactor metagenome TaxID=1076179 RepID=A0A645DMI1_9ZZZZ
MKKTIAIACMGALCSFGALSGFAAEGVISADLLNVRLKPDLKSSVAVKLDKGFKVNVTGESGDFYEIAAPVTAPVYISAVYLDVDTTTAPLKMYVSGSTAAASYGVLPKGSKVKLIDIDHYGWAQIEPPAGIKLYVAKNYVNVTGEVPKTETPTGKPEGKKDAAVKPEEKKAEAPAVKPEEKNVEKPAVKPEEKKAAKPAAKPEEKKAEKPVEQPPAAMSPATEKALKDIGVDLSKGKALSVTGTLLKLDTTTVPVLRYVLMRNGTHEFYLCGDKIDFDSFGSSAVTLKGQSFRVPGWRVPVIYVDSATAAK